MDGESGGSDENVSIDEKEQRRRDYTIEIWSSVIYKKKAVL